MSRTADRPALRPGEFVPLVALLISLVALATDAMLPALPAIGRDPRGAAPERCPVRDYGHVPGARPRPDGLRPPFRPHRTQARHPRRPRAVHGRVPHEHPRAHLRGDDRGPRAAGFRRGGTARRDHGPGARPVRRTPDGASSCRSRWPSSSSFPLSPRPLDKGSNGSEAGARYSPPSSSWPRPRSHGSDCASRRPCRPPAGDH